MTEPKQLDPFQSPYAFYGSELRRLREEAGLTQDALGKLVFVSAAYIGQIETTIRKPQLDLSIRLDGALGSGKHLQHLCLMAKKSKPLYTGGHASYFAEAAYHEARASAIAEYAPTLVPGLLQTEGYIRAGIKATRPRAQVPEVDEVVNAQRERAALLNDPARPEFWAILHETVLRMPVGGSAVMAEQLRSIAALVRAGRVIVQVLRFQDGAHAMMAGMVSLMSFDDAPDLAYTEGVHSGQIIDENEVVGLYWKSYDLARAVALSPEASLALLDSAAEEYARCTPPLT
ncbi:helix-turn-helix transcriptional regulator [Streptomyces sp. NBC_00669]|uniref:helix-turn-helix domain-containing protein n=1 Tax=Streptomyces sp. NBC_00669 TaxID=2976011 RepID=UPI002E3576E3|nr:helix-turn-helix transcriptional regulator [Streptomyces sp. NBC_00669]